jgi:hypothetical protein
MRSIFVCLALSALGLSARGAELKPNCTLPFAKIATKATIDANCGVSGDATGALAQQDEVKNDFCAKGKAFALTFDDYAPLQNAAVAKLGAQYTPPANRSVLRDLVTLRGSKIGEGDVVRIVAYVDRARYSDVEDGESVNCHEKNDPDNAVHIPLVQKQGDDECTSVTAEISPHFRPVSWTPANLNNLTVPVRITGQLFFDGSHKPCAEGKTENPKRRAVWEIHPVYAVEVCKVANQCNATNDKNWIALDQFVSAASH